MSSTVPRRRWVMTFLALTFSAVAFAQATGQNTDTTAVGQQVRTAQEQLLQAAIQGNKDEVGKFLADNLSWVAAGGQVQGKDQVLAALPAPVRSVDVQQVVPMANSAILVATVHMKNGSERRAMQEWVNRDGQWKVTSHESAPIGGAEAAAAGTSGRTAESEARTIEPTLKSDDERAVWRAQMDIVNAFSRGDTAAYSKLTADPFTRVESNGQVYNRSEWLDYVRQNAKQPLKPSPVSDVQIDVDRSNNLARVTLTMVPFGPNGAPGQTERQTRIFALRDGQWQQVAAISTPVTQQ